MNIKRVFKIFILILILLMLVSNDVNAFTIRGLTGNSKDTSEIELIGNKSIQIVSTIGSIISVIVIVVLGIKYIMGSVEEKASYKKTLIPFLIGAIFIFAASSIASIFYNIAIKI